MGLKKAIIIRLGSSLVLRDYFFLLIQFKTKLLMKILLVILIVFIVIWAICARYNFKWFQFAFYHPEGRWITLEADGMALFWTFFPFVNMIVAIMNLAISPKHEKFRSKKESNFFKPKNPLT